MPQAAMPSITVCVWYGVWYGGWYGWAVRRYGGWYGGRYGGWHGGWYGGWYDEAVRRHRIKPKSRTPLGDVRRSTR